ncbi:MAG: cobalt-zinc-cadmium resistance protein [Rhodoferax sp.]|nr:cobalt-zinc-cadmium resistance protein [Rhodoferax sp.]
MRSWLIVLFLFVLPFQFVWASAAPYCAHEAYSSAAKHFGHHDHKHAAGGEIKLAGGEDNASAGLDDVDCESCHLGCSPPFLKLAPTIFSELQGANLGPPSARYISHVPDGPDRPKQVDLTAAARFGGGVVLDLLIT